MPFDTRKWRAAVRAAFAGGTANRFGSGPWLPDGWYTADSWPRFRKFNGITLTISETLIEVQTVERGPDYTAGPRSREVETLTKIGDFTATLGPDDIWRLAPEDCPTDKGYWHHGSRTAYGPGLYHCAGVISIPGLYRKREKLVNEFTPPPGEEGGSTTTPTDTDETEPSTIQTSYATNPADLNGLNTFCRMIIDEFFIPPAASFQDDYISGTQLFPPTLDPDGEPGKEVYWTDVALAVLAAGEWTAEVALGSGDTSGSYGPNAGGVENGDFWTHSFSHSGNLSLAFA